MAEIPNVRRLSDVLIHLRLKDNGVAVDFTSLSDIRTLAYSESQKAVAGPCPCEIDEEDHTILDVRYNVDVHQYLGIAKIVLRCTYMGRTKTYDVPVLNFVDTTAEATGVLVLPDPEISVELEVDDVSTSLLDDAINAAFAAAELADLRADEASSAAAGAAEAATLAREKAQAANSAAGRANSSATNANNAAAAAVAATESIQELETAIEEAEAAREQQAESDHTRAGSDHETAGSDHTRAESDHGTASDDHTQANSDHGRAQTDHDTAASDHSTASTDHTTAASDHITAASDHSTAESDHTRAEEDHAIVQGYDTRLTNVEGEVSQLGQKVDEIAKRFIPKDHLELGYYDQVGKDVGDQVNDTFSATGVRSSVKISVRKNDIIFLYTYSSSVTTGAVRALVVTDSSGIIKYITPSVNTYDKTATPIKVTCEQDGYAYIECDTDKTAYFYCVVTTPGYTENLLKAYPIEESHKILFGNDSSNLGLKNIGYLLRTGNKGSTAWTAPLAETDYGYVKQNCEEGDVYFVNAHGELYGRAYAFCESDNTVIESSEASTGVSKLVVAPKNTAYIVVNNHFTENPSPIAIKVGSAALKQLFNEELRLNKYINTDIEVPVFGPNATKIPVTITDTFLKTYGVGSTADTTPATGTNYGYIKQNCVAGDVFLVYSKGGNTGLAYAFCSAEDIVLASSSPQEIVSGLVIAPERTSYIVVNNYFATIANPILYKLTDGALCSLKREISSVVTRETEKIKATNIGGFYLKNNKIVLSGASISEPRNGYFEYAMQELGISYLNTSVASTNIYKLANLLYSSPDDFTDFDVLIMSHIHNYDVFTLPSGKNEFTATDYENDANIGPYIKTSSYYTGYLQAAGGYTADELYAMGFDYVLKKWASLCYALRNTTGYDSVFGKPFQVILYTYWHDARTIYNASVRQLAKKWGVSLIKDDENIGFSKNQVNPATGGQWSVLYGDTTGYVPTEVIDGVTYGVHPCRMTSANYDAWQQSGVLDKDYLPFIQKVRANILIHTLKDAIMN